VYDQLRPGHGASCPGGQPYQSGTCCYPIETMDILETVLCTISCVQAMQQDALVVNHINQVLVAIETIDILETVLCKTAASRPCSKMPWWSIISIRYFLISHRDNRYSRDSTMIISCVQVMDHLAHMVNHTNQVRLVATIEIIDILEKVLCMSAASRPGIQKPFKYTV
jgi:hypothetical protein